MARVAELGAKRLLDELAQQPTVLSRLLERQGPSIVQAAEAIRRFRPKGIVLVARGSSDNAAVYGRYLFEIQNRIPAFLAAPSTVTLYGAGPRLKGYAVIAVSQSGRGEDVVSYVKEARRQGAFTLAVVNDPRSPLAKASQSCLDFLAGPELCVPATKTVTAQMLAFAALSSALRGRGLEKALELVPKAVAAAVDKRAEALAVAKRLSQAKSISVLGRGFAYPVALELALKLKETSYRRAEPFSAADFIHGPIALVERGHLILGVDVGGRSSAACAEAFERVKERGGQVLALRLPSTDRSTLPEHLAPLPTLAFGQLVALELARLEGIDPSRPRGLRKVTSTR